MKTTVEYPVILRNKHNYVRAFIPDFDTWVDALTFGSAEAEAKQYIEDLVEEKMQNGEEIPQPTKLLHIGAMIGDIVKLLRVDVETDEEERYTLTPKGIASLALVNAGFADSVDDERIDAFWEDFDKTMEFFGYIETSEDDADDR